MKSILLFTISLLLSATSLAQNGINYKALIKDANGDVVANQAVTIQFSIAVPGAGAAAYAESHTTTTNANGIAIVTIGEGSPIFGDFTTLKWHKNIQNRIRNYDFNTFLEPKFHNDLEILQNHLVEPKS